MRGLVPALPTPAPLIHRLPGVLQEDAFLQRFLIAFDDSLAPVFTSLDCLSCYVDPTLAPSDFLDWLAGWVGVELDDEWSLEQRRTVVARAAGVHRRAGTVEGIALALGLALDAEVSVVDSGGCSWSAKPGGALPGAAAPSITVTLGVDNPEGIDTRRIEALLDAVKPAHVRHEYQLKTRSSSKVGE